MPITKFAWVIFVVDGGGGAVDAIENTEQYLNKRDYLGVNMNAGEVYSHVDACRLGDDGPDPNRSPFHDTSLLPKYADVIYDVSDMICVLSSLLLKGTW